MSKGIKILLFILLLVTLVAIFSTVMYYLKTNKPLEKDNTGLCNDGQQNISDPELCNQISISETKGKLLSEKDDSPCLTEQQVIDNATVCNELLTKYAFYYNNISYCQRLKEPNIQLYCTSILNQNEKICSIEEPGLNKICNIIKDISFSEDFDKTEIDINMINYAYTIVATLKKDSNYCNNIAKTSRWDIDMAECLSFSE